MVRDYRRQFCQSPRLVFNGRHSLIIRRLSVGVDIFHADLLIMDVVDQTDMEHAVAICQSLRHDNRVIKILLLVRPEQAAVRSQSVDAQNAGLIDSFVFYDSSLTYLLAKLEAL